VNRGAGADTFTNLYEDADRRREKQEMINECVMREEHSFHPDIGINRSFSRAEISADEMYQRLTNARRETEEHL
jgi:hypothetical protein